jgi:hypothetical protein
MWNSIPWHCMGGWGDKLHDPTAFPGKESLVSTEYEAPWPSERPEEFLLVSLVSFLVSSGGVSPFGTSAINWPIVPAPDDR